MISIIIVSWNVAELLAACIESILAGQGDLSLEIIVVDSASSDHTVAMLRDRFPQVKLLAQTENVGFTRGNNIGLAAARGDYLFLLNPDTEIVGSALAVLRDYMDAHPDVGMVGTHTLNSDRVTTQSTRRRFPTPLIGFFESTWLQPYAPKRLLDYYYVVDGASDTAIRDVDWVQGSALLARRKVYEQIGGLDEGFVMYSEELDWCKRAKDAGWRIVYLGTASIVHHGGKSTEQVVARSHIYFQQSKLRYFRKHHGAGIAHMLRAFLLLNYGAQLGIEAAKYALGHKRDLRRERIAAYAQVLRSGLKVT
ncbi:MAG: glycosyltransferase family 2 protein [Anaerolinea sp.]|nr:glycosyltransferase family 2 protein [Anaerolinea sp.]